MIQVHTIRRIHLNLEASEVGVEFTTKEGQQSRATFDLAEVGDLSTLASHLKDLLEKKIEEVPNTKPEALTTVLQQVRMSRKEHDGLQQNIRLSTKRLDGLRRQIKTNEDRVQRRSERPQGT